MPSPSRPRRKQKLTPFTVDELLDNPAMSGFVSFLEVHPEQRTSPPQPIAIDDVSSSLPGGRLPPAGNVLPHSSLHTDGNILPERILPSGGNLLPDGSQLPACSQPPGGTLQPECNLPPASTQPLSEHAPNLQPIRSPGSSLRPDSNLLADIEEPESASNLRPDSDLVGNADSTLQSDRSLLPGTELRTENGRTVRIREARGVQDAHTPAEHTLWQILWRKGTDDTPTTRLIRAGLADISRWTGAHKTSCRAYLRALIAKLALEEAETFDACAGKEGARVYRVYSAAAILERRREAGYTHVIRTGAVTFVHPATGRRLLPGGDL